MTRFEIQPVSIGDVPDMGTSRPIAVRTFCFNHENAAGLECQIGGAQEAHCHDQREKK